MLFPIALLKHIACVQTVFWHQNKKQASTHAQEWEQSFEKFMNFNRQPFCFHSEGQLSVFIGLQSGV